jgi:hypothetical protein
VAYYGRTDIEGIALGIIKKIPTNLKQSSEIVNEFGPIRYDRGEVGRVGTAVLSSKGSNGISRIVTLNVGMASNPVYFDGGGVVGKGNHSSDGPGE